MGASSKTRCRFSLHMSVAVAIVIAGCGDGRPPLVSVRGVVKLDGKPVAHAEVMFVPRPGGRPSSAVTNADGEFELESFREGDGALIGTHDVAIAKAERTGTTEAQDADPLAPMSLDTTTSARRTQLKWLLPKKYSDVKTSGLTATVEPDTENHFEFDLDSS